MQAFCDRFDRLDRAGGTGERVETLARYFDRTPAAWGVRQSRAIVDAGCSS
jgi:hypothetical protein